MTQSGNATTVITDGGNEMSNFQAAYAFTVIISFVLGMAFFFIDGMLLWSILFFVIVMILVLLKITWNIAGWAENVTRKLGED